MKRIVISMHITLDGFVAGPNGEMDWIIVDDELFDLVTPLTDNADTALYGRVTYGMMDSYWPTAADLPGATKHDIEHSKWYKTADKIVLSSSMKGETLPRTRIISGDVSGEIKEIKQQGGKDILIFGSPTACHLLMQHDLIDDYWLFVNPVLLGKGIPLFEQIPGKTKLKLKTTEKLKSGVVCLHYERDRSGL